jgi:molecular chaperone GrpE (heat shock protein)
MKPWIWIKSGLALIRTPRIEPVDSRNDDWRPGIVRQFSDWLYELTEEAGADALPETTGEDIPDLRSFYTELTVLRGAIELQVKAARQAAREAREAREAGAADLRQREDRLLTAVEAIRGELKRAKAEARDDLLEEIIEIRESIQNTLRALQTDPLPARFWNRKASRLRENIRDGQGRLLRKIDDTLRRLRVVPLAREGEDFDARAMRAVAVCPAGGRPAGQVARIVRQGYRREEKILRYAEVEVTE